MSQQSKVNIQVSYVYDPMCSWCWGYRPTWLALQQAIHEQLPNVHINYSLGGLAPDSDEPMSLHTQEVLKHGWKRIANQLGTKFNFDYWEKCKPRRSTYPACRACLIARESGLEKQMILAIQEAYYLNAKNPSDDDTLIALAKKIGLDEIAFSKQLFSPAIQQQLLSEIQQTHTLPINGFPSLVLSIDGQHQRIPLSYLHWEKSFDQIQKVINLKLRKGYLGVIMRALQYKSI